MQSRGRKFRLDVGDEKRMRRDGKEKAEGGKERKG